MEMNLATTIIIPPEQKSKDPLIDLTRNLIFNLASVDRAFKEVEELINEHRNLHNGGSSRLQSLIGPDLGVFFTELNLIDALNEYDSVYALKARRFIPPSFSEIRHILNLAQLRAVAQSLKLISFDADGTIYDDGSNLEKDSPIVNLMMALLHAGFYVAIVTAAGYPRDPTSYEKRFSALIETFKERKTPCEVLSRFYVVGGECNYLFRMSTNVQDPYHLEYVPSEEWLEPEFLLIEESVIVEFLNKAQQCLVENSQRMRLDQKFRIIRKERAVGMIRLDMSWQGPRKEVLDEIAFATQAVLLHEKVPFCAFNSGKDVWVDVGHKSLAVESLMKHFKLAPSEVLHTGDQMSKTGNDFRQSFMMDILLTLTELELLVLHYGSEILKKPDTC